MKHEERRSLKVLMYLTAIWLWVQGIAVMLFPLGVLSLFGVNTFSYAVMSPIRIVGVLFFMLGVLAWDSTRKPPRHIGISLFLGVTFLMSALARTVGILAEGEVGPIANTVFLGVEAVLGLAHAGWWYLWSGREEKTGKKTKK